MIKKMQLAITRVLNKAKLFNLMDAIQQKLNNIKTKFRYILY